MKWKQPLTQNFLNIDGLTKKKMKSRKTKTALVQQLCCRLTFPFNRWQCDPHFIWTASMSANPDELKIAFCNFCDSNCLTVYLFICFFPPRLLRLLCVQFSVQSRSTNTPESSLFCSHWWFLWSKCEIRTSLSLSNIRPDHLGSSGFPLLLQDTDCCYSVNVSSDRQYWLTALMKTIWFYVTQSCFRLDFCFPKTKWKFN